MAKRRMEHSDLILQCSHAAQHYMKSTGCEHADITERTHALNHFAQGFYCGVRFLEKYGDVVSDNERYNEGHHQGLG